MSDLISRQAAIDALNKEIIKRRLLDDINDGMLDEFDTENILRKLPSAQPERKKGKWIERWHDNKHVIGDMACSACGAQMLLTFPRFCPSCGADMRGEEK